MNGQLRHLLDSTVIQDEPGGWDDFTEDIERNLDERIIHLKYPNTLLFIGDGYFYLRQKFEDAYCNEVGYACEQYWNGAWQRVCEGTIIISDITWNLSKGTADTPITDSTVGARILNNKQVTTFPAATLSKSGEEIDEVPPIDIEVFDPAAAEATYLGTTRIAYDWKLCMRHMIAFITDGAVGFRSDWYDNLPDDERFAMLNGVNTRTGAIDTRPPEYSFKDLWEIAWRSDNLMAGIEQTYAGPVFRVETEDFWYGNESTVVLLHQEDIEQSIDTDLLYSSVKMGSEGAIKNEAIASAFSLPYVGLRTFSEESYALVGQCNTDNVLDLTLPFVVCSNAIEDAVVNNNNDNDDAVFVIQYDRITSKATKRDYLTSDGVPWLYNERFLNLNVVRRWRLPASGVNYYADQDAAFRAEFTIEPGPSYVDNSFGVNGIQPGNSPVVSGNHAFGSTVPAVQVEQRWQFDNDYTLPNFDADNNWGNGTAQGSPVSAANSRYTAPIRGLYAFEVGQVITCTHYDLPSGIPFTFARRTYILPYVEVRHFNSSGTLIDTFLRGVTAPGITRNDWPFINAVGTYTNVCNVEVYMQPNDYIEVWFRVGTWVSAFTGLGAFQYPQAFYPVSSSTVPAHYVRYVLPPSSWVRTIYVATFGGEVVTADPDDYYATKLEFTRFIDNVGWAEHRDNFDLSLGVAHDTDTVRRGYIRSASRKIATGDTEWELIANRKQTNV